MKNVCLFTINKVQKTKEDLNKHLSLISLNEKTYQKISGQPRQDSIQIQPRFKDQTCSQSNKGTNYWSPEEERILLDKHKQFGNKWSKISNFLDSRSDNNIKNFFYSKFRRVLRRILKELYKDKSFVSNFLETGLIPECKMTVNYIYKVLKKNDVVFERVNKEIVQNLLAFNENCNIHQEKTETKNLINNQNSFQDSTKENNENDSLRDNFVQLRNEIQLATNQNNYFNKINQHQINFDNLTQGLNSITNSISISNSYSNSNSIPDTKRDANYFVNFMGSQEKTRSDCINEITISETSNRYRDEKRGSDFTIQKKLFDGEMNFFRCNNERKRKNSEDKGKENVNDEFFSFFNGNEEEIQDCFSDLSVLLPN